MKKEQVYIAYGLDEKDESIMKEIEKRADGKIVDTLRRSSLS